MPATPPTPLRIRVHAVRVTRGELALLRGRASTAGVPVSTYLRQRALAHRVRVRPGRLEASQLRHLVRLGTELNALAHAANTSHRIVSPLELARLLEQIRQLLRRVRQRLGA